MTAPAVSVVIPTWNRVDLIARCLDSLREQDFRDTEIVVVDDGSTDKTVRVLQRDYPYVTIVRLLLNRGFASAVNTGLRVVTGRWVFLLNNDMTLAPDCLERLMRRAEESGAAMVAPMVYFDDDRDIVYSAGDGITRGGRPFSHGHGVRRDGFSPPDTIFGVSMGAGLFREDLFERIGVLDESFVAYFEDADWCFRARLAGHDAVLAPDAHAYHIGSATIQDRLWQRTAHCYRNQALFVLKNFPMRLYWRNASHVVRERMHQFRRLFDAVRAERGSAAALRTVAVNWTQLMSNLPDAYAARRRIQRDRTISIDELDALLSDAP